MTSSSESTRGYEDNVETRKNKLLEEEHQALRQTTSEENREKIIETLSSIVLFRQMFESQDESEQAQLVESMFERVCARDEVVISQGDEGNYFYVITCGTFDVYVRSPGESVNSLGLGRNVAQIKDKGYFGELALLYNQVEMHPLPKNNVY